MSDGANLITCWMEVFGMIDYGTRLLPSLTSFLVSYYNLEMQVRHKHA